MFCHSNTIVKCKRFLMYGENLKIMPQEVGLLTMINNLDFGLNILIIYQVQDWKINYVNNA